MEIENYKQTIVMFFGECLFDYTFERGVGKELGSLFINRVDPDKREKRFEFSIDMGKMRQNLNGGEWSKWYDYLGGNE